MTKSKSNSYEKALEEIKEIVWKIEQGENTVDQLSVMVEKALALISECKSKLRSTEENIQTLFNDSNQEEN